MAPQIVLPVVATETKRSVSIAKKEAYLEDVSGFDIHKKRHVTEFTKDESVTLRYLFGCELSKDEIRLVKGLCGLCDSITEPPTCLSESDINTPTNTNVVSLVKSESPTPTHNGCLSKLICGVENRNRKGSKIKVKNSSDKKFLSLEVANLFPRPLFKSRSLTLGSKRELLRIKEGLPYLPHGWIEVKLRRTGGKREGRIDTLMYSESGLRFKSMVEVTNFLEAVKITGGNEKVAFLYRRSLKGLKQR